MKRLSIAPMLLFLSPAVAQGQSDPAAIKAAADAQTAQLAVTKAQLDLTGSIRNSFPNNASAIASGEKSSEAQILKYITYRAAATKLVDALVKGGWTTNGVTPLVIVGSTPPSLALLNAYNSDLATAKIALVNANALWKTAFAMSDKAAPPPPPGVSPYFVGVGGAAALGIVTNGISMLAPSSSVAGGALTADNALIATIVEQALVAANAKQDFRDFMIARDGDAAAARLIAPLNDERTKAKTNYVTQYLPKTGVKNPNDLKDAALKVAGTSLAASLAAYDALNAKLLSDAGGLPLAVAIERQAETAKTPYSARPLLYILGNEASLTVETEKGPAHWFDSHPFVLRAVVTFDYLLIASEDINGGKRGTVSCIVTATRFKGVPSQSLDDLRAGNVCGQDITPKPVSKTHG